MAGRFIGLSLLAAVGFLLLFSSSADVGATTYKMGYSTRLSCNGPNGVYNGGYGAVGSDDSCTNDVNYGARGANLTADILSRFSVPLAAPKYSNYKILRTFGTPSTWKIATDKEIPDGAAVGKLVSQSTLALFGGGCSTTLVVTIPMYDCSTDNSAGNLISWDASQAGKNLLQGKKGDLPIGCKKYPAHANAQAGSVKPRARYMGSTVVTDNMSPTQLQFLMFTSEQLSQLAAPQATIKDEMGYVNFVVLNNPVNAQPAGDSLDEFCTPLESNTTLWGRTGGFGSLDNDVTPPWTCPAGYPCAAGNFWTVKDACGDAVDNDGDNVVDEGCGIQRVKNPAAAKGMWGTGSHPDGAYGQSYRDADNDGVNNDEDECPFTDDLGLDPDADFIDSACDPTPNTANQDPDADNWRAQQDWCPLTFQTAQTDADDDRIADECDTIAAGGLGPNTPDGPYVNDQPSGSICIGAADADGDGFCDATEALNPTGTNVLSVGTQAGGLAGEDDADTPAYATPRCSDGLDNDSDTYIDAADAGCSVPEYTALDYAIVAADAPPGTAPRTCSNWAYYDSQSGAAHNGAGAQVNEDQDANTNAADANCGVIAGDADQDGILDAPDNCDNAWNPTQVDTDSDGTGDACDTDDDADGVNDNIEWANGTDAKNVCNPRNFDITANGVINSLDIGAFAQAVKKIGSPPADRACTPAVNYDVCR